MDDELAFNLLCYLFSSSPFHTTRGQDNNKHLKPLFLHERQNISFKLLSSEPAFHKQIGPLANGFFLFFLDGMVGIENERGNSRTAPRLKSLNIINC